MMDFHNDHGCGTNKILLCEAPLSCVNFHLLKNVAIFMSLPRLSSCICHVILDVHAWRGVFDLCLNPATLTLLVGVSKKLGGIKCIHAVSNFGHRMGPFGPRVEPYS